MNGRTVVVTGATRGIGRVFALALGEAGANVVVAGRGDAAERVAEEVRALGANASAVVIDVTQRLDLRRARDHAIEQFGTVDVLVNNAGAFINAPALDTNDAEWRRIMAINLDAVWVGSQIFGETFVEQRRGVIVNVGSISAEIVNRPQWQSPYNASKAAVHHLTKSLAAEWGPFGVRVNAIAPGYIRTENSQVDEPRFRRQWIEDSALQRAGDTVELGPAVVFLASDASSFMTGSILTIDGGYTVF